MKRSSVFILLFSLILLPKAFGKQLEERSDMDFFEEDNSKVWITVFVHGIMSIKPHITIANFMRFLNDDVQNSLYGDTVNIIRNKPFFYQNQAMQGVGLIPIDLDDKQKGAAAPLMGRLYDQMDAFSAPKAKQNYYYTYGWSSLLSRRARYNDSKILIAEIEKLVAEFRAQGIEPKIRLIGYSHGGTVIIKMALVKQIEGIKISFTVDQAIILGTPIQYDTDYLINDSLFKGVYNFFSKGDRIQRLDFFSSGQFFSEHIFKSRIGFVLPKKLVQIEIKVIRKKNEGCKEFCLDEINGCTLFDGKRRSKDIRNVSPGHTELWFFGWTPMNYRKTFPFYPLPIITFAPYILKKIKPYKNSFCPEIPVVVTIDPRRDYMVIGNGCCKKSTTTLPFIGFDNLMKLKHQALAVMPDMSMYNSNLFDQHVGESFHEANVIQRKRRCCPD